MAASKACQNCGEENLRPSRWRPKDGWVRPLWVTPVRCRSCGQRQYRLSLWNIAVTVGILMLIAFIVGIVVMMLPAEKHQPPEDLGAAPPASLSG